MSDYILRTPGQTVTLSLELVDNVTPANNPVTGETCVVSIRRLSDDKWFDFVAVAWDTVAFGALAAEHKQALTDKSDGTYEHDWDQATADGGVARAYEMHYQVTSIGDFENMVSKEQWVFTEELIAPTVDQVADEVWLDAARARTLTAWLGGVKQVTFTLEDEDGDPVGNVALHFYNPSGVHVCTLITDTTTGAVTVGLDPGVGYTVLKGANPSYSYDENPETFTVGAAATQAVTLTCTAATIPAVGGVGLCRVYAYLRHAAGANAGQAVGVGEGTLQLVEVLARPAGDDVAYDAQNTAGETDDDGLGLVYLDIVQGCKVRLRVTWNDVDEAGVAEVKSRMVTLEATDLAGAAYDLGQDLD